MVRHQLAWATAAIAAAAVYAPAARATTSNVTCGETITQSVTLTADVNCPGPSTSTGVTIDAAGITLNLNGHGILTGNGSPAILDDGYDSVTIKNGSVDSSLMGGGIELMNASDVDIVKMASDPISNDLTIIGGQDDLIQDSSFRGFDTVNAVNTDGLRFLHDSIDAPDYSALTLSNVNDSSVTRTAIVSGGGDGVSLTGSGDLITQNTVSGGIGVSSGAQDAVEDNQIMDGSDIRVAEAVTATRVRGNTLTAGSILVDGSSARVVDNTVQAGPAQIEVSGPDARITGNTADTSYDTGITVSGSGAHIARNTADDDHGDGIDVTGPGARIMGNTTNGNTENGIEIADPSAYIHRNTAEDNTLFGITATPGDTGSLNVASGNNTVNGVPGQQCLNISCMAPTS